MNASDTTLFDERAFPWRGPGDDRFTMLYLGTVSRRHGVDQCVRVLPLVRDRIPGLKLLIHCKLAEGEGRPLDELRELAAELGVADLVEFGPPLPLQDVPAVMSRASVGVFTPHMDVHIDMALSLKVPELVAMRVPVVAVRTRIMQLLFRDGEVAMFEDGDLSAFADWLVRLHADPSLGRAMAARATRFTAERSWANEFVGYLALLAQLTGTELTTATAKGPNRASA